MCAPWSQHKIKLMAESKPADDSTKAVIEEVKDEGDAKEQPPPLISADETAESAGDNAGQGDSGKPRNQSRSEKKCRKALSKLGLKPVTGIHRVTLKRAGNQLFVLLKPDVFRAPGTDTFIIFGEARLEDDSAVLQKKAQQMLSEESAKLQKEQAATPEKSTPKVEEVEEGTAGEVAEEEAVDETGVEAKDIDLVLTQTGVSRARAVKALKAHDGDIVNAIMELTM